MYSQLPTGCKLLLLFEQNGGWESNWQTWLPGHQLSVEACLLCQPICMLHSPTVLQNQITITILYLIKIYKQRTVWNQINNSNNTPFWSWFSGLVTLCSSLKVNICHIYPNIRKSISPKFSLEKCVSLEFQCSYRFLGPSFTMILSSSTFTTKYDAFLQTV